MNVVKKEKNTLTDVDIKAEGNVNIGDKTTINVYGMEANKKDLEFVIRLYAALIAVFAIASLLFMFMPKVADAFPKDYIPSFAAGGFFALSSLVLILFLRSKNQSISKTISDEIQNNS